MSGINIPRDGRMVNQQVTTDVERLSFGVTVAGKSGTETMYVHYYTFVDAQDLFRKLSAALGHHDLDDHRFYPNGDDHHHDTGTGVSPADGT